MSETLEYSQLTPMQQKDVRKRWPISAHDLYLYHLSRDGRVLCRVKKQKAGAVRVALK